MTAYAAAQFGQVDTIIAINLSSAFHTSRLALPAMKAVDNG